MHRKNIEKEKNMKVFYKILLIIFNLSMLPTFIEDDKAICFFISLALIIYLLSDLCKRYKRAMDFGTYDYAKSNKRFYDNDYYDEYYNSFNDYNSNSNKVVFSKEDDEIINSYHKKYQPKYKVVTSSDTMTKIAKTAKVKDKKIKVLETIEVEKKKTMSLLPIKEIFKKELDKKKVKTKENVDVITFENKKEISELTKGIYDAIIESMRILKYSTTRISRILQSITHVSTNEKNINIYVNERLLCECDEIPKILIENTINKYCKKIINLTDDFNVKFIKVEHLNIFDYYFNSKTKNCE